MRNFHIIGEYNIELTNMVNKPQESIHLCAHCGKRLWVTLFSYKLETGERVCYDCYIKDKHQKIMEKRKKFQRWVKDTIERIRGVREEDLEILKDYITNAMSFYGYSESTVKSHIRCIKIFLQKTQTSPEEITPFLLEKFLEENGYARSTKETYRNHISKFAYFARHRYLPAMAYSWSRGM